MTAIVPRRFPVRSYMRAPGIMFVTTPAALCVIACSARAGDADHSLLLRQSDGSYVGVDVGGHAPYEVEKPYPDANWSAVYDNRGNRVGTIENQPGGPVFYDERGNRR